MEGYLPLTPHFKWGIFPNPKHIFHGVMFPFRLGHLQLFTHLPSLPTSQETDVLYRKLVPSLQETPWGNTHGEWRGYWPAFGSVFFFVIFFWCSYPKNPGLSWDILRMGLQPLIPQGFGFLGIHKLGRFCSQREGKCAVNIIYIIYYPYTIIVCGI